tara:strand:+ start:2257 stop:3096 length:840 start_codon:yes stop_codon:yes gene_type:complete
MKKLEKLLYRKKIVEFQLNQYHKGITIYTNLCSEIKNILETKSFENNYDKYILEKEFIENDLIAKNFITSYKTNQREYQNYLIEEIDKVKNETDEIEFNDISNQVNELAKIELFGETTLRPENVENIEIIEDIKANISLIDKLIMAIEKKLKSKLSLYEKAKLEKELYDNQVHIITLTKRLTQREKYYYKDFKPRFDKELKEAKLNLESMLNLANQMVDLKIDPKLIFLLDEYENHKNDDEKLWLFYTALKARLKRITKYMRKNKSLFKGNMSLAKKDF